MISIRKKTYEQAKHLVQCGLTDDQIIKVVSVDKNTIQAIRAKRVAHSRTQVENMLRAAAVERLRDEGWSRKQFQKMFGYKSEVSIINLEKQAERFDYMVI